MDWQTVRQPFDELTARVLGFLPQLVSAILILILGWVVAVLVQKAIVRFLKLARLDTLSEKVGVANILSKGDINYTLSEVIGVLIYWLVLFAAVSAAVNALQLMAAAELLNQVILYLPNVIAGVLVLVLGLFFANIIANTVRTAAANAGVQQSRLLAQVTQVAIILFAVVQALNQLRVDTTVLHFVIQAVLAALALGVGLAIGLGCKDLAARYVSQFLDSFKSRR